MTNEDEEETPVDFIPEPNIFGLPTPKTEPVQPSIPRPRQKFNLEPSFPIDRFLAGVIDMLLLGLIIHFIDYVWLFPNNGFKYNHTASYVALLIGCLYHGFFDSSDWQGTPGKRWLGIKISNNKGARISFLNSVGRFLAKAISLVVFLLGYVNIFINEDRRAWHDMIAGTYVIADKEIDDETRRKKRKNGYIIAILLFVVTCMIYINAYTLASEARGQKLDTDQEKNDKESDVAATNNSMKTAKIAERDFLFNDSINGFRVLVKRGFYYTTTTPSLAFFTFKNDSNNLKVYWGVMKEVITKKFASGTYLDEIYKGDKKFRISNTKILPVIHGYAVEQGSIWRIKNNDSTSSLIRAYVKNNTLYIITIINDEKDKPLLENEITRQIFGSFQITE